MNKYLILYRAPIDANKQMAESTPEMQEEGMKAWMQWAQKCGENLIDLGQPLANGRQISPEGSQNAKSQIAGYSILQAENLASAENMMEGHPHLSWNAACTIEIHEAQPLPGM